MGFRVFEQGLEPIIARTTMRIPETMISGIPHILGLRALM